MDTFQITVLIIAAVLLILIFVTIGILTKYSQTDNVFPPIANTCPDYWAVDSAGNCIIPPTSSSLNTGKIYTGSTINISASKDDTSKSYTPGYSSANGTINFSDPLWGTLGKTTTCAKKTWANTNTLNWDGISNFNSCA
uniref:Uncharacterized protein n=1 Tax=viral metagenome TaxID=1070528 RepID=A0A6C0HHT3_9ZZZZ